MAHARARARSALVGLARSGPSRLRGPVARATRRLRRDLTGPLVSVVVAVSDDETTRIGPCLDSLRAQTHRNLDIVVVPFGRAERVLETAARHAGEDWRIRVRRPAPGLAAARNTGVADAKGALVVVVGSGDDLLPGAVARLATTHEDSGSPLVVGRMREPRLPRFVPDAPFGAAHHETVLRTTLAATPVAITDLGLGNKLFTRELWDRSGLRFDDEVPSGADVAARLLHAAPSYDLLTQATYVPTGRRDGAAVGAAGDLIERLDDWVATNERIADLVGSFGIPEAVDWRVWGVLDASVQALLVDAEEADERRWALLRDHVADLLARADSWVWDRLSVEARVRLWLLRHDHRDALAELVIRPYAPDLPTVTADGVVRAEPLVAGLEVPDDLHVLGPEQTRLRAVLRDVGWTGPTTLELGLCAAIDNVHLDGFPEVACALVRDGGHDGLRVDLPLTQRRDPRGNFGGRMFQDWSWGGFVVRLDTAHLAAAGPGAWQLEVTITVAGVTRTGLVDLPDDHGAHDLAEDHRLAPRPASAAPSSDETCPVEGQPLPSRGSGGALSRATVGEEQGEQQDEAGGRLDVGVAPRRTPVAVVVAPAAARLTELSVSGRTVTATVHAGAGGPVVAVRATLGSLRVRAAVEGGAVRLTLPAPPPGERRWTLRAELAGGGEAPLAGPADDTLHLAVGEGEVVGTRGASGDLELWEARGLLAVDDVALDGPDGLDLTVRGRWLAGSRPGRPDGDVHVDLVGAKVTLAGDVTEDGGRLEARFRLEHDPWGLGATPVPHGRHHLRIRSAYGAERALIGDGLVDAVHRFVPGHAYATEVMRTGRRFDVELTRPLAPGERAPYVQRDLSRWSSSQEVPLEPASVYFQVYGGSSATDSQLAIFEELRRVRPDLRVYWGVLGSPATAPEGAEPVVVLSREYYRVMSAAAHLVMNVDPPRWWEPRPGQRLLQTFHGYPAKSMGLRMWRGKGFTPHRVAAELERTSGKWDLILTPSPEMDRHYREEYAWDGPIHSEGYPRDDLLVSPDADRVRRETRERLGIREDQVAVLYAPTWRDDMASEWGNAEMVTHLDAEATARALGPGYVLLMRGHRFHLSSGADGAGGSREGMARILDVTEHPEINHLVLAADASVLDYSSLRFDVALTGQPMVFLVPDLAAYVGGVRGFLYDFAESAPGPLVDTADEVVALLRDVPALRERCAPQIAAFNERFSRFQDGRAAERVVRAFFGERPDTIQPESSREEPDQ